MGESRQARDRRRHARNRRFADKAAFHGINWDHEDHYRLYDWIMTARPGDMGQHAQTWKNIGAGIGATTEEIQKSLTRLRDSWRGAAAAGAGESVARLTQWAHDASDRANRIGTGLERYTEAVQQAQHAMPPPGFAHAEQAFLHGHMPASTGGSSNAILLSKLLDDHKPNVEAARAAKAQAVRVMTIYASQSQEVHDTMPWFDAAPAVTIGTDDAAGSTISDGPHPVWPAPLPPRPPWPTPAWPPSAPSEPPAATPTETRDSSTTTPAFADPTGGGAGHGHSGYSTGYGTGGPGSGGVAEPTRGGSGLGTGNLLAPRGAGNTSGSSGTTPMSGARSHDNDDSVHKNKYPVKTNLFDDPELSQLCPPVIGG